MVTKVKSILLLMTLCLTGLAAWASPTKGSCESSAVDLSISKYTKVPGSVSVTLTRSYDTVSATYSTNYVYYYKATLTRGKEYTVWLEGDDGKTIAINDIYPREATGEDEFEPGAMFATVSGAWGSRQVMDEEEWYIDPEDPEMSDPTSWTYYFFITGKQGETATLKFVQANALPDGIEENPLEINPTTAEQSVSKNFVKNQYSYYFDADLEAGRRYLFATSGGDARGTYTLDCDGYGKYTPYDAWSTAYNTSMSFDPSDDGSVNICVCGTTNQNEAAFTLRYRVMPQRGIAAHPATSIAVNDAKPFTPGRINAAKSDYYDDIIDEQLFVMEAEKGQRYLFKTTGAQTNLLMRLYDKTGSVIGESTQNGTAAYDVCYGFEATYAGKYYVGVAVNLADDDLDDPGKTSATLALIEADPIAGSPDAWDFADDTYLGATPINLVPGDSDVEPTAGNPAGTDGWHELGETDWEDVFALSVRAGQSYRLRVAATNEILTYTTNIVITSKTNVVIGTTTNVVITTKTNVVITAKTNLDVDVFKMNGSKEVAIETSGDINRWPGGSPLQIHATENGTYYIRLSVAEGNGLRYPKYKVHAIAYDTETLSGDALGALKVVLNGTPSATWSLDSEKAAYGSGDSVLLSTGKSYSIKFSKVKGFSTPDTITGVSVDNKKETVEEVWYNDTYDPKDDTEAGATKWSVSAKLQTLERTLLAGDSEDNFAITGKDGQFYDFALDQDGDEDAVFSIVNTQENQIYCKDVTSVSRLSLPTSKGKYILKVYHREAAKPLSTTYTISGIFVQVGAIKFAKTAVTVKKTAGYMTVNVNRTAKGGRVRVRYATQDGTAKAGTRYVATSGTLDWSDGDSKAKTITVTVIPDVVPVKTGDETFTINLTALDETELKDGEYKAAISTPTCTVTVKETSKAASAEEAYLKKQPKAATTKTEDVGLETGTFYGVLACKSDATDFGSVRLASVTFTASTAATPVLSAKVSCGGKNYTFKGTGWDNVDSTLYQKTLTDDGNTLTLALEGGETTDAVAWKNAGGKVTLVLNDITYTGGIYRQNAKIQSYLDGVLDFTGYYTMALVRTNAMAYAAGSGMPLYPEGNGYLTLTVDNKGKAKVAGLLADNTKISLSVTACAVTSYAGTTNALVVPLYYAKSTCCFGGTLVLRPQAITQVKPDGALENPDPYNADCDVVFDARQSALVWNNDNAALSYDGEDGWAFDILPVGGWFDTVFNLQGYYKNYALNVSTAQLTAGFPKEALADGYSYVATANNDPNGYPVTLVSDALSTAKKSLVKVSGVTDLEESTNPFNVQVKLARATGIVTGSFSLWSENATTGKQKEITGIKHYGITLLQRDYASEPFLPENVLTAGFFNQKTKVGSRSWTLSRAFNILTK